MASGKPLSPPQETSQQATSLSLLLRAKLLDADAWQRLVRIYSPLLHHWCRQSGLSPDDADDVVQETLAAVLRGMPTFDVDDQRHSFRGWLRTIVRHRLIDLFRRRKITPRGAGGTDAQLQLAEVCDPLADEEDENPAETSLVFRAAVEVIQAEFEPLTARAFWLTMVEDRSPASVAAELGLSLNAVYKSKYRVLARLREVLDGLE